VPARDLAAIDAIAVVQKRRIQKSYKSSAQNTSLYWIQEGVIPKNTFSVTRSMTVITTSDGAEFVIVVTQAKPGGAPGYRGYH
jgi:hypothetical protein